MVKIGKICYFDMKSAINQNQKLMWMFFVNSRQELTKIQFFTKIGTFKALSEISYLILGLNFEVLPPQIMIINGGCI